eukprot:4004839-Pleurochrysis_carterae.AAC.2
MAVLAQTRRACGCAESTCQSDCSVSGLHDDGQRGLRCGGAARTGSSNAASSVVGVATAAGAVESGIPAAVNSLIAAAGCRRGGETRGRKLCRSKWGNVDTAALTVRFAGKRLFTPFLITRSASALDRARALAPARLACAHVMARGPAEIFDFVAPSA